MIFIVFMTYLCCETFKTNHYDKNNFFYSDVPDIRLSNVVKRRYALKDRVEELGYSNITGKATRVIKYDLGTQESLNLQTLD